MAMRHSDVIKMGSGRLQGLNLSIELYIPIDVGEGEHDLDRRQLDGGGEVGCLIALPEVALPEVPDDMSRILRDQQVLPQAWNSLIDFTFIVAIIFLAGRR